MNCNKCDGELTDLIYRRHINNTMHLVGWCKDCGWRHLPYRGDLGLEIEDSSKRLKSKKKRKKKRKPTQTTSLLDV